MGTNRTITILSFTSFVALFFLLKLNSSVILPDDIWMMYVEKFHDQPPPWTSHLENYRYAGVVASWFVHQLGFKYHSLNVLWALVLTGGMAWCSYEFNRYCLLPEHAFPFVFGAVAFYGYFADVYQFPQSYLIFGMSLSFVAVSLRILRLDACPLSVAVAALAILGSLTSYQAYSLVVLLAGALRFYQSVIIFKKDNRDAFWMVLRAILAFLVAAIGFLILRKIINADIGRPVSPENVVSNLGAYSTEILSPFLNPKGLAVIFPTYERIVYGFAVFVAITVGCVLSILRKNPFALLATTGLIIAVAIGPNPYNLFGAILWNSPRSMSAMVFFHVGCLMVLVSWVGLPTYRITVFAAIFFIALCLNSQAKLFSLNMRQMERDKLVVHLITKDIQNITDITKPTKLAVFSGVHGSLGDDGIKYMDYGAGAFERVWSNSRVFAVLTEYPFIALDRAPVGSCAQPLGVEDWRIERAGDVIVVCMRATDGP
ncbi:hypothetical protein [Brucella inopinata]|uniref:hypothetical protein n=1 Tax=Brucella inopinata TaxID=1218315 RepID=UPI000870E9AC|nr:hypothetical protein [Brucella inopinata]SCD22797.1 putative membrane protein [Brucella inopinata]